MADTVSVCIPTYNGRDFLDDCIASVLAQTHPVDEIVIVDDCSKDDTRAIVERFARSDARIRCFVNDRNLGLVGNWNRCVEHASGRWIKFVFQDDVLGPACIERLLDAADDGVDLVGARRDFIFETPPSDALLAFYRDSQALIDGTFAGRTRLDAETCRAFALDLFGHNLVGEPSSVLFRRDCFARFGAFRPELIMSCDLEYWLRIAVHSGVAFVPETLSHFRVHAGATSAANHGHRQFRMHALDNLLLLRDFAREPVYAPLRAHAARRIPPIDLEAWLRRRMHEAVATAESARRDRGDARLVEELEDFYRLFPDLQVSRPAHWAWRVQRRLQPRRPVAAH